MKLRLSLLVVTTLALVSVVSANIQFTLSIDPRYSQDGRLNSDFGSTILVVSSTEALPDRAVIECQTFRLETTASDLNLLAQSELSDQAWNNKASVEISPQVPSAYIIAKAEDHKGIWTVQCEINYKQSGPGIAADPNVTFDGHLQIKGAEYENSVIFLRSNCSGTLPSGIVGEEIICAFWWDLNSVQISISSDFVELKCNPDCEFHEFYTASDKPTLLSFKSSTEGYQMIAWTPARWCFPPLPSNVEAVGGSTTLLWTSGAQAHEKSVSGGASSSKGISLLSGLALCVGCLALVVVAAGIVIRRRRSSASVLDSELYRPLPVEQA